jgi:hypothetical protein
MIVVKIVGGLGNQIAQYLYGRYCADQLCVALKLDISTYLTYTLHDYGLQKFNLRAEIASDSEILAARACGTVLEHTILFDPLIAPQVRDGVYLDGYWGDYRYTQSALAQLQTEFLPVQSLHESNLTVLAEIEASESVSLHIRRRDYVTNPNYIVLPVSYYEDALEEIYARVPSAHIYIFSNDIPWSKSNLHPSGPHTYVAGNDDSRNSDDFQLMRSCKHHIIANSKFSCWAAMLDLKYGVVIAPELCFRSDMSHIITTLDQVDQPVWPRHWLSMPVRFTQPAGPDSQCTFGRNGIGTSKPMVVGIWNYYEELNVDGFIFKNSNASIGHNLLKPFGDLYAYGQANGIHFVTVDQVASLEVLDAIIFFDRPSQDNPTVLPLLALDIPKYLCIFETEVIKPDNWDVTFHEVFNHVFTWSDAHVDHQRYSKFNFAIDPESPFNFEVLKTEFYQRKLCTLIAGAKGAQHANELYSERVRTIQWFQTNAPNDFDLYGVGWNQEIFPSYCGAVKNKLSTLARYRFAICYENAKNYPGYITEKILDCFLAGTVPVYLGAPNIAHWIPADCFIDRNAFQNNAELYQFLSGMTAETHGHYLDRIGSLLASPSIYPFTIANFIETLTTIIVRDISKLDVKNSLLHLNPEHTLTGWWFKGWLGAE